LSANNERPPAPPLLSTKLHAPVRREFVSRRKLVGLMSIPRLPKLTLISSPAGWGKSTLLANWYSADSEKRRFAWLVLDREDNDETRYWTYLVEALRTIDPDFGVRSLSMLGAPGVDVVREVLPVLISETRNLLRESVLVIDDYHLIRNAEIHTGMNLLLHHLPPVLRVVVASRSEPPFRLASLRASGELTEITAAHLAFSEVEANALLNDLLGLELEPHDVALLTQRTEGWAAGIYLAALWLRDQTDRREFIAHFAGDDRHVVDYLGAEVLAAQPEEISRFLRRTSILERFCARLCDFVSGEEGSAKTLQEIERSNLFLVPLDTRREWYRFHHLFAELLRHELTLAEPDAAPVLHRRAAIWFLEAGFASEAIHHTIAAGDIAAAGDLIALQWILFVNSGKNGTVDRWLRALPDEALQSDARLCLARAWTSYSVGRLDEVLAWTDTAERAALPGEFRDGTTSVASGVANVRAGFWLLAGDMGRAREFARKASALEDESSPWRAVAFNCLGAASYWLGDTTEAVAMLQETVRLGLAQIPIVALYALGHLAVFATEMGRWDEADDLVSRALHVSRECGAEEYWATAAAQLARGKLLERKGDLAQAEAAITRSLALARRGSGPVEISYALLALAEVRFSVGRRTEARVLLDEARQMVQQCPDPGTLPERVSHVYRRLRIPPRQSTAMPSGEMTERELSVLRLLDTNLSQREIGAALYVSLNTIKTHTKSIFRKLGASTREEAVARARELNLL
jgi:LuxR family maltose regulon positive regulatory protein